MSGEYIDRRAIADKLSHCINRLRKQHGPFDRYADGFDTAVDIVLKAPTATDVVEVVRCKDCSWFIAREEGAGDCDMIFGFTGPVSENGYCYCGKRKDGADNGKSVYV